MRYLCSECDYAATTASDLKRLFKNKHEGVRYPCSKCNYAATTSCDLKKHVESKHEGVRYPCPQCDHVATHRSSLNKHVKYKHTAQWIIQTQQSCVQCIIHILSVSKEFIIFKVIFYKNFAI